MTQTTIIQQNQNNVIRRSFGFFWLVCLFLFAAVSTGYAWPSDGDWHPIYRGYTQLGDPQNDAIGNDARDIVGDDTNSAAFLYSDGNFIYFRVRVDSDPRADTVTGALRPFGWGFLVDTNQNLDDYEYMVMLDGINNPDLMYLAQNTDQGILGDASDKADDPPLWQENLNYNNNFRVLSPTDSGGPSSTFGGTGDYFIDWYIPFEQFKGSLGLDDNTVIRYFVGSANNAMVLNADLVAGSTLYDGTSNYVLPAGVQPTTGSVYFAQNSDGSGDLTEFFAGATIYLKVLDDDLNTSNSKIDTVTVKVSAPSGDLESIITLTETTYNSATFVGALVTVDAAEADNDGTLQTTPIEIITVTYIDEADSTSPTPLTDQPRTDTCNVKPAADIEVSKTVNVATPNEGDTVIYNVTILNNGPSAASGIQINDILPSGVTYSAHTAPPGTSYNPSSGLWIAGSLTKDETKSLFISATVDSGTAGGAPIVNTATKTTAAQIDPTPENNTDSASISVTGADLALVKTVDDTSPAMSGTVNFTLAVTNQGSYNATGVELTDNLPAAIWSSISVTSIDQGSWSYNSTTGDFIWDIGTIPDTTPMPTTVTVELAATLDGAVANGTTITNIATISALDQKDPDSGNNSDAVELTVGGIDLSLAKVVTSPLPATPNVGDTVIFTLTVTNDAAASTTATGIQVTDLMPSGLSFVSYNSTQGTYTDTGGNGLWDIGSLLPGDTAELTLDANVDTGTAGQTLTNNAVISAYNEPDVDTDDQSAAAAVTVKAIDLQIEKVVDTPTPTSNSGTLVYTITATNLSTAYAATAVSIFDQLPGAVTYVSHVASQGTYDTTTHLWSGIALAAKESPDNPAQTDHQATLTITVSYNLGKNDPKSFFNTASLSSSTPEDSNSTNNTGTASVSVNGTDLSVAKTMNTGYNDYPASGATTQFLITLTNNGPSAATGITVKDLMPTDFSCDSGTPSLGAFTNNGGKCDWTIASLPIYNSATLVVTSTVSAADGTTANNRATISTVDQPDPSSGNNTASKLVYVGGSDLALTKTVDKPNPNEGETVKFTVTLTNDGTNNVSGIEVTDLIPAGLTYISYNSTAGTTYNSASGVWSVGTVTYAAGPPETKGVATLDLYTTVDANTSGTTITNNAVITAADAIDPNTVNNSASASLSIQQADVYVNKSAGTLTPFVNDTVEFSIVVGNNGPDTATGVVVTDQLLPAEFSFVSAAPTLGTYNSVSGEWTVGTVAKGATETLTLTATVTGAYDVNITNTATKTRADQYDPNTTNDSQNVVLTPDAIDLRLIKDVNNTTPEEGTNVVYTLTIYNQDTLRTATGIQVTDLLVPTDGLFYVSDTAAAPSTYNSTTGIWNIGTLGPMSNTSMTLTATALAGSGGMTLTNNAAISAHDQYDNDTANNSATIDISPVAAPNISSVKTVALPSGSFYIPGAIVQYTITTTNSGGGAVDNNTVVVSDNIPVNLDMMVTDTPIVTFSYNDPDPGNGQALTYNSATGLCFSTAACPATPGDCTDPAFNHTPSAAADGTDAAISCLRVAPEGIFEASTAAGDPSFTITFKARIE